MAPHAILPRGTRSTGLRWMSALLVLAALLLSACTAPRLAYQRMDWLASWRLGEYVDLDSAQERRFDTAFKELWDWHRQEELPRYAADLREMAAASGGPVEAGQLHAWADRARQHTRRSLERAQPAACELIATFSDRQRDDVLKKIDDDLADDVEEFIQPAEAKRRKAANKRLRKSMERWVGALSAEQAEQVAAWGQTRRLRDEAWVDDRRAWRERFAAVLAQRGEPGFCTALGDVFLPAAPADAPPDPARQELFEFLAEFSAGLSEKQHRHLRDELLEFADDLTHLHTA